MSLRTAIFSTTALVILTSTASADVTAKEIWGEWKSYMSAFGYTVDGAEAMSGDTLTITDLTMTAPMPDDTGSLAMTIDSIDFVENGDGSVNMVLPEVLPMTFAAQGPEGEVVKGTVEYSMQNMNMRASGDLSKITYDVSADQLGVALSEMIIDGKTLPNDALAVSITSKDLNSQTISQPGALRKFSQSGTVGESRYKVNFKSPEGDDSAAISGTIASMEFTADMALPETLDPENMSKALSEGLKIVGGFSYANSASEFAFTDSGDSMSGTSSAETAQLDFSMDSAGLNYAGGSKGTDLSFAGGGIPIPIAAQLGEVAFNLLIPVTKSDEPSDFAFGLTLGDFETSEILWSLLDAEQILPRDPATISFDLVGKAKLFFDLFDQDQMIEAAESEEQPGELHAVTLKNLLVSVAGAKLSGRGDFTFDNTDHTDLTSFDGLPKPTGGVDLALQGGNGLMDKLVQMGLLPQEQAMGARMMMGLFTRPGEGDDSITTKIEINEAGHILANGQRIQ